MNLSRCFFATTAATACVTLLSLPSEAANLFGTDFIQFDQNTTVRFTYDGSNHFYESTLSVYLINPTSGYVDKASAVPIFEEVKPANGGAIPGTCGTTVSVCTVEIKFVAGQTYTLGLSNTNPNNNTPGFSPFVFSSTKSNNATNLGPNDAPNYGQQRAVFGSFGSTTEGTSFPNSGSFASANPFAGPVKIGFEDGGFDGYFDRNGNFIVTTPNDGDFNDFRITAVVVPIPPPVAGLLLFGTLSFLRRRQERSQIENQGLRG
jgi:hypothetical protein